MGKDTLQHRYKPKLFLRQVGETKISLPKATKDQIKSDIHALLNQGPIEELESEFLNKNEKNLRDNFHIYKKDIELENIQDIFSIQDKASNYLAGKISTKDKNLYYLVNIGELVDILGNKKIMMMSKNIQVYIAHTFKSNSA